MQNRLRAKLLQGETLHGALVTMPSPPIAQAMATAGLDWIAIDLEHGLIDVGALHGLIIATNGTPCTPIARVPLDQPSLARSFLDAGGMGLIVPAIRSAQDLRRAMDYAKYAPVGHRGVGPIYASMNCGVSIPEYIAAANEAVTIFALIEHIDAIENLEEILAVDGLDGAIIAPYDLSASMNLPGQIGHPAVQRAIERAESLIAASPVALGGAAISPQGASDEIKKGYSILTIGNDTVLVQNAIMQFL